MKRTVIRFPVILTVLFVSLSLHSQENQVFSPFVSRLKAVVDGSAITLTWQDSEDLSGTLKIFRYTEELTNENVGLAEYLGQAEPGTQYYVDYPSDDRKYYYAVLIENSDGELYDYIIPFRNATSKGIAVERIATIEDLSTTISGITLTAGDEFLRIQFSSSKPDRQVALYRHIRPVISVNDVLNATLVAILPAGTVEYQDYVIAGVPYYYGLFDAELVQSGKYLFSAGKNISTQSAELPIKVSFSFSDSVRYDRTQPLPLIILADPITGSRPLGPSLLQTMPAVKTLSAATLQAVNRLIGQPKAATAVKADPEVLDIEKNIGSNNIKGEAYTLATIVQTAFSTGDWVNAESKLLDFLRTRHAEDVTYRARFYLAQVYYFENRLRESFLAFLVVKEYYYKYARKWIDLLFLKLAER